MTTPRRAALALFALLATAPAFAPGLAGTARADEVTEPSTGVPFAAQRSFDGHAMTLVGTGVRKKFIVKVYAMGLYVDDDARKAWRGEAPQAWVMGGRFGKAGVLHFVRGVDAGKIRGAFEESLEAERDAAATKDATNAFLALFDKDVASGQEIVIETSADGRIDVSIGGAKRSGPTSPALAKALWGIWLGAKPISSDMKTSLVERLK